MAIDSVLLRCGSCKTANRVPTRRLPEHPRCGKCGGVIDFPRSPVEVTERIFDHEVLDHPGYVLLFFWASWCAHCRGMFPVIEDLAREQAGIVKVGLINTEREPQLAGRFSIMSVPRLTLYRNGRVADDLDGAVSKPRLVAWIESHLKA
ncbi:MAG: thioredoxin domain-containing protein [Nitrospiraceae bacterium]|nr:thioredoxin domain-containing protein [Nitrospiraceae bacterium]